MQACLCGGTNVLKRRKSQHFWFITSFRPRRCFQMNRLMDLCPGNVSRMSLYRFDLTLLLFRALKGRMVLTSSFEHRFGLFPLHTPLGSDQ